MYERLETAMMIGFGRKFATAFKTEPRFGGLENSEAKIAPASIPRPSFTPVTCHRLRLSVVPSYRQCISYFSFSQGIAGL
jgi:hypothetical protein